MIKKLFYVLALTTVIAAKSQVVSTISWVNYLSDDATISSISTALDANSKVYATGRKYVSTEDIVIQCTDSMGVVQWTYVYDNGGYDSPNKIRINSSGYTFVTGVSDGMGKDYITIVLDPSGTLVWSSRYDGGVGSADDEAFDLCVDHNSDVYVTGKSRNSGGNWDAVTLKLDGTNGSQIWKHVFTGGGTNNFGICLTLANNQGDVIVAGNSENFGNGTDIVAYQVNVGSGTIGWQKNINGTANSNDSCSSIILSGANVVIAGMLNNTGTGNDYSLTKLDASSGSNLFQTVYDYSSNDFATSLVKDNTSNLAVTGLAFNSVTGEYEYHTNLYDSLGTKYWTNKKRIFTSSPNVKPRIVTDTIAWHFYVSGEIYRASTDILVYQLTPGGNIGWEKIFDGPHYVNGTDVATNLAVNGIGEVFVSAMTTNSGGSFDLTTIKINQTPIYYPIDFNNANEPPASNVLFYQNTGEILYSDLSSATDIEYYTKNTSPQFFFRKNSLSFVTRVADTLGTDSTDRIDLNFYRANLHSEISRFEIQNEGYLNYFKAYCGGATGITDVKGARRLMVPEIYPGVDLHYYSNEDGLKLYFVVKPFSGASSIWLKFDGSISTSLNGSNELNVTSNLSDFSFKAPKFYNVFGTVTGTTVTFTTTTISGALSNISGNDYNFSIGAYNTMFPLVIELEQKAVGVSTHAECGDWSTFYGGTGYESPNAVVADASGNTFLVGGTDNPNVPNVSGGYLTTTTGYDAFMVKLNSNGAGVFGTYFSGNGNCEGFGAGVNSSGQIYLSGYSADAAMPVVPTGNSSLQGMQDVFLAKFNSTGNNLLFSRYFGGNDYDYNPAGLIIDASDNVYVAGHTHSNSNFPFPTSNPSGSYDQITSSASLSYPDGFVAKFNSSNALVWSTYFGGSGAESITSIKTLSSGNIITAGVTGSSTRASSNVSNPPCGVPLSTSDFPDCVASGAYNQAYGGGSQDAFIAEFNSNGTLVWSTYVGGAAQESAPSKVAVNPINSNQVYLLGNSSHDSYTDLAFATGSQYLQAYNSSGARGFITKFTNRGIAWGSFVGDGYNVFLHDGVCDGSGNVYATGNVVAGGYYGTSCVPVPSTNNITDFPKCAPSGIFSQAGYGGGGSGSGDAFLMGFNSSDHLFWSTFYGSAGFEDGFGLAFDSFSNKLCFTGITNSNASGFPLFNPLTGNYQQNTNAGSSASFFYPTGNKDGFFAKFCLSSPSMVGITKNTLNELSQGANLFPNPNNGDFNLVINQTPNNKVYYELMDITGKVMESGSKDLTEKNAKFMLSNKNYGHGMYLLKIKSGEKQTVIKFVIE